MDSFPSRCGGRNRNGIRSRCGAKRPSSIVDLFGPSPGYRDDYLQATLDGGLPHRLLGTDPAPGEQLRLPKLKHAPCQKIYEDTLRHTVRLQMANGSDLAIDRQKPRGPCWKGPSKRRETENSAPRVSVDSSSEMKAYWAKRKNASCEGLETRSLANARIEPILILVGFRGCRRLDQVEIKPPSIGRI